MNTENYYPASALFCFGVVFVLANTMGTFLFALESWQKYGSRSKKQTNVPSVIHIRLEAV